MQKSLCFESWNDVFALTMRIPKKLTVVPRRINKTNGCAAHQQKGPIVLSSQGNDQDWQSEILLLPEQPWGVSGYSAPGFRNL